MKLPAHIPTSPMIANRLVRGALPALGQLQTLVTIPYRHPRSREFRHREQSYHALSR